jgi:hypothetical protein
MNPKTYGVRFAFETSSGDSVRNAKDEFFYVGCCLAMPVAVEIFDQCSLGSLNVDLLVKTGGTDDIFVTALLIVREWSPGDVALDSIFIVKNAHKLSI